MRKLKIHFAPSVSSEVTLRCTRHVEVVLDTFESSEPLSEVQSFAVQYLKDSYLSKYVSESTDTPDERRHRAIVKWLGVERRNQRTNERLLTTDPLFFGTVHAWTILLKAGQIVESIIGSSPPEDLLSYGSFSGGATTSRRRGSGMVPSKFEGSLDVTPSCWGAFCESGILSTRWPDYNQGLLNPRFVKGNVLFTVPKTAVIDRVACKEPDGNIFCQKAVGDFFRRRLRSRARIDLNDQSVNRELARRGSIDNSLSTIDLSSASDSLTTSLVMALLPRDWFNLLDNLRCHKTFIDGLSHTNEMFSSMGNGFTFELESLIFLALARSTAWSLGTRGRISVYGDDIIVPRLLAKPVLTVLRWCGFVPNVSKTFVTGPFRESCGGHYYRGHDVTPIYLKRPLKDVSDLIHHANAWRAWLIRTGCDWLHDDPTKSNALLEHWKWCKSRIPRALHGGWDLSSRFQLVSPDKPILRLTQVTKLDLRCEARLQIGAYLSRLVELDRRCEAPISDVDTSYFRVSTPRYGLRRCQDEPYVFGFARPLFTFEQLTGVGFAPDGAGHPAKGGVLT